MSQDNTNETTFSLRYKMKRQDACKILLPKTKPYKN